MIQLLILNIWINLWALKLKHAYVLRKSFHNLCYWTNDDNCLKILICRLRLNTCNCYRYQLHTTAIRQLQKTKQSKKTNKQTKQKHKKRQEKDWSSYREGYVGIPLVGLTSPLFCVCPKSEPGLLKSHVVNCFRVQWVKMRADCSFCWCWWNCWPSLFRGDCSFCWHWWNCWPSLFNFLFKTEQ